MAQFQRFLSPCRSKAARERMRAYTTVNSGHMVRCFGDELLSKCRASAIESDFFLTGCY